jgi:hypothetical protein
LQPNYYVVRDANGQQIAYVYYSNDPDRRSAAKLLRRDEELLSGGKVLMREHALTGRHARCKLITSRPGGIPISRAYTNRGSVSATSGMDAAASVAQTLRAVVAPVSATINVTRVLFSIVRARLAGV